MPPNLNLYTLHANHPGGRPASYSEGGGRRALEPVARRRRSHRHAGLNFWASGFGLRA